MTSAGMAYIRGYYQVPAEINRPVVFDGKPGRIVGTSDAHLMIRLDGETEPIPVHPTWHMEYPAVMREEA